MDHVTPTSRITRSSIKDSHKSEMNTAQGSQGVGSKRLVPHPEALDASPINISAVQGLQPIYKADEYWLGKINITSDYDIINFLSQNLPPRVREKFRKTIFGYFLEIPNFRTSKQIIHSLLLRELSQPDNDCIYLKVGGEILYFGVEYFLLISGLKAVAEDGYQPFETGAATKFCKRYFGKKAEIKKADIEALFKTDENGINKFESDKDCLRMALVYFISYFLMGWDPNVRIPSMYFDCVKTGEYAKAAWGILSFQTTIHELKKNGKRKKCPGSYRVAGCPFIFELWFFEVCGACQGLVCDRNQVEGTEFRPRMFHWRTSVADFRRSFLDDKLFDKKAEHLHFRKIEATDQEIESLSLQQFFPFHDPLQLDHQHVYTQGKEDELPMPSSLRSQTSNHDAVLNALASLTVQLQQGFDILNKKIDKSYKRLDALERTLKKITRDIFEEDVKEIEKEQMATEDESEKMADGDKEEEIDHGAELAENEGEKYDVVQEKISQGSISFDHENTERSLIPYKPLPFQILIDPDFDPIARFNIHLMTHIASKDVSSLDDDLDKQDFKNHVNEDKIDVVQKEEQVPVANEGKFEVKINKPAEVNTVKVENREQDAVFTLKRMQDVEVCGVEITDEDMQKTSCKRRKIDEFDSVGCMISINNS